MELTKGISTLAVWVSSSSREVGALEPLCEGRLVLFEKKRERASYPKSYPKSMVGFDER